MLPYSDCLERGWHAEESCLDAIYCEYTFHVHWCLKDHEEPAQPFCLYNPHAPREVEELMPEEAQEKCKQLKEIYLVSDKCQRYFMTNIRLYLAYKALA